MKAALNVVIVIAWFAISICAWAQGAPPNLAALHAGTEKAFLARDLVKAGDLAKSLMAAASEVRDPKEAGFAALMTARVFSAGGDYTQALVSLGQALRIYRDSNDSTGIATVFNEEAIAYRYTGKLPLAFDLHEQARSIFDKLNDKEGL